MDDNLFGILVFTGAVVAFLLVASFTYCTRHNIKRWQQYLKEKKENEAKKRNESTPENPTDPPGQATNPSIEITTIEDAQASKIGSISGATAFPFTSQSLSEAAASSGGTHTQNGSPWTFQQTAFLGTSQSRNNNNNNNNNNNDNNKNNNNVDVDNDLRSNQRKSIGGVISSWSDLKSSTDIYKRKTNSPPADYSSSPQQHQGNKSAAVDVHEILIQKENDNGKGKGKRKGNGKGKGKGKGKSSADKYKAIDETGL